MSKQFDLISLGEAVVEIFRKGFDVPLYEVGEFTGPYPSGAPAITVDTFARLGGRTAFIGTVGNDEFGTALLNRFSNDGIDITQCARLDRMMTGMAITNYFSNGSRSFLYNFTTAATAFMEEKHIQKEFIRKSRWLHII
jgi:sugar/nucleoside kinase (ribokinase family)